MSIENITFSGGYATITDDSGNSTTYPVLVKLAQVVSALLRVLMDRDIVDDNVLDNPSTGIDVQLQHLVDILIDYYGVDFENEGKSY